MESKERCHHLGCPSSRMVTEKGRHVMNAKLLIVGLAAVFALSGCVWYGGDPGYYGYPYGYGYYGYPYRYPYGYGYYGYPYGYRYRYPYGYGYYGYP